MKHFVRGDRLFAFEDDGSQDYLITPDMQAVSDAEAEAIRNPPEPHATTVDRALDLVREQRAPILSALDGMQASAAAQWFATFTASGMAAAEPLVTLAGQIEALKQALRDAPATLGPQFGALPSFDAMVLTGRAYYAQLVASCPADIRSAFNSMA